MRQQLQRQRVHKSLTAEAQRTQRAAELKKMSYLSSLRNSAFSAPLR